MLHIRKLSSLLIAALLVIMLAPAAFAQDTQDMAPAIEVSDQAAENDTVTIDRVVSDGPGWVVIHADDDGQPGDVLGQTAVSDGESTDVVVELDTGLLADLGLGEDVEAGDTLHAMLHQDLGEEGTFDFPGDDAPAVDENGEVVLASFNVTGLGQEDDADVGATGQVTPTDQITPTDTTNGEDLEPAVEVNDQDIEDDTVTIERVVSDGPGWLVIHADANGQPGDVLGQTAVQDGENMDVIVEIDMSVLRDQDFDDDVVEEATMYAMLHEDLGTEGTYEFPGADTPAQVDGETVVEPFTVGGLDLQITPTDEVTPTDEITPTDDITPTDEVTPTTPGDEATPGALPETGGSQAPWTPILVVAIGLALVVGALLLMSRRETNDIHIDD